MDDDRADEITSVILKGLAVLAGFAIVVAIGTWLLVNGLGLNQSNDTGGVVGSPIDVTPLPTTALPVPTQSPTANGGNRAGQSGTGSGTVSTRTSKGSHGLYMNATPAVVQPMQRVNITGTYAGHDNMALLVQRLENGIWADFPTQAQVNMGTFETYVQTARAGPNKFRVFDPAANVGSNVVTIVVG